MTVGAPEPEGPFDDRAELLELVRSVRAAIEWQSATGTTGLPRDPDAKRRAQKASEPVPPVLGERDARPELHAAAAITQADLSLDAERQAGRSAGRLELETPSGAQPSELESKAVTALPVLRVADAPSLDILAESVARCRACELCERRKQTVFSRGTGKSGLCFVGEGPGADEDAQGEPFVGAAGQLLDRMIAAMGIDRDDVYVANIVKCRPPDNRKPTPAEMAACVPYLHRQLELVAPQVIVALGATALEGLLGKTGGITRHRGRFSLYRGKIAVMPTFHPAYLLRQPSAKREVWSDLQEVLRHLGRPLKGA